VGDISGLCFSLESDFNSISPAVGGYTLEFIAFSDNETTAAGGKFEIGNNAFKTTAAGGQSITGVSSGAAVLGLPYPISAYRSYRWHSGTDDADTSVGVYSGSTLKVRKNLLFTAADNRAVYVSDGSKLLAAPSQNFSRNAGADWQSEEVGGLLINGAGNHAVLVRNGSYAGLGSVYAKCFKSYLSDTAATKTTQVVVAAEANSVAEFPVVPIGTDNYYESVVGVFSPFGAAPWGSNSGALGAVGYYTTSTGVGLADDILAIMFRASKNSSIFIEPNTVAVISAFDGGSGESDSFSYLNFYVVEQSSKMGQFPKANPNANSIATTQFSHMNSNGGTPTQKIMSRSGGFKYNLSTPSQYYRWWTPTGNQPNGGGGRTAGIWSTTGEAVRKNGFAILLPFTYTSKVTANMPSTVCPAIFGSLVLGVTYNNTTLQVIQSTGSGGTGSGLVTQSTSLGLIQQNNSNFYTKTNS
jgi:hypothetical protein